LEQARVSLAGLPTATVQEWPPTVYTTGIRGTDGIGDTAFIMPMMTGTMTITPPITRGMIVSMVARRTPTASGDFANATRDTPSRGVSVELEQILI